jgi:hypothetical protein
MINQQPSPPVFNDSTVSLFFPHCLSSLLLRQIYRDRYATVRRATTVDNQAVHSCNKDKRRRRLDFGREKTAQGQRRFLSHTPTHSLTAQISLVAQIIRVQRYTTNDVYSLADGTGMLDARYWHSTFSTGTHINDDYARSRCQLIDDFAELQVTFVVVLPRR